MSRFSRRLTSVGLVALGAALFWHFYPRLFPGPQGRAVNHRALATRVLAEFLAAKFPAGSVLAVANPFTLEPGHPPEIYSFQRAQLAALEKTFGPGRLQVVYPKLRPEASQEPGRLVPPGATTPLSYLVGPESFDQLAAAHPDAKLFLSLIGLPQGIQNRPLWEGKTAFGLLLPDLTILGSPAAVRQAFESKKIVAVILNKPGAPPEKEGSRDPRQEFDRRFLLVTSDNLDRLLQMYPHLF